MPFACTTRAGEGVGGAAALLSRLLARRLRDSADGSLPATRLRRVPWQANGRAGRWGRVGEGTACPQGVCGRLARLADTRGRIPFFWLIQIVGMGRAAITCGAASQGRLRSGRPAPAEGAVHTSQSQSQTKILRLIGPPPNHKLILPGDRRTTVWAGVRRRRYQLIKPQGAT